MSGQWADCLLFALRVIRFFLHFSFDAMGLLLVACAEDFKRTHDVESPELSTFQQGVEETKQTADAAFRHAALEKNDVVHPSPGNSCETFREEHSHLSKKDGRLSRVEEAVYANTDLHRGDREKPRVTGLSSSLQQTEVISDSISGLHPLQYEPRDFGLSPTSGQFLDGFASLAGSPSDLDSLAHSSSMPVTSPTPEADLEGHDRSLGKTGGQNTVAQSRRTQTSSGRSRRDISIRQTLAVEVLAIGGCDCLPSIFQKLFGQTPKEPERNHCTLKGTSPSVVRAKMTTVLGTLKENGRIDWSNAEPITDISHCLRLMGHTDLPKLIIISSTVVDDNPEFLHTFLQSWTNDLQQSSLNVLVIENEVDSNHKTVIPEGLKGVLGEYVHNVWSWRENDSQGVAEKLEALIYQHAASRKDTKAFCNLAQAVLSERQRGLRIVGLKKFQQIANEFGDTLDISEEIQHLERKGFVLGKRLLAQTNFSSHQKHSSSSYEDSSLFLVLDPLWFYGTLNSVLGAIVHRQNRRQVNVVPVARHKGFYSPSEVNEVLQLCMPEVSETTKKSFFETCRVYGYINVLDDQKIHGPGDSFVAATNGNDRTSNYRGSYFIPASLISEKLPPAPGRLVSPIALRSPGIDRAKIPVSAFYDLVSLLAKHFPLAVKCTAYTARFNPEPSHVLELEYAEEGTCITFTMLVDSEDPTGYSTRTLAVCSTVRELIVSHIKEASQYSPVLRQLKLQFAAVVQSIDADGQKCFDFVDLYDLDVITSTCQLFSLGNQPFKPSPNFLLWYGGMQQTSLIQKDFVKLAEEIDGLAAAGWLFEKTAITLDELEDISRVDPPARSYRLLLALAKRQDHGDALLKEIRQNPTLKAKGNQTPRNTSLNSSSADTGVDNSSLSATTQKTKPRSPLEETDSRISANIPPCNSQVAIEATSNGGSVTNTCDDRPHSVPWSPDDLSVNSSNTESIRRGVQPTDVPSEARDINAELLGSSRSSLTPAVEAGDETDGATQAPVYADKSLYSRTAQSPTASSNNTNFPESTISQDGLTTVDATQSDQSRQRRKEDPQIQPISEAKYYHVKRATDDFNDQPKRDGGKLIGSGPYGTVYYGVLHSEFGGEFEVAIKRLKKASSLQPSQVEWSRKQFGTEMNILTRYVHPNIVRLLGFSSDGPELCLLYEYMALGALSHRLDCKDKTRPIEWQFRLSIARDISMALEFLHTRFNQHVIHCDVKSDNVLVGKQFEAKLSNFGRAVVGTNDSEQQSMTISAVDSESGLSVRTKIRPYMPPEVAEGVISPKVDVYGLGIILYELATGLPPYSTKKKQDLKDYIDFIEQQNVDLLKMLDPKAHWPKGRGSHGKYAFGLELLQVAKLATTKDRQQRPEITTVSLRLKSLSDKVERS